MGLCSSGLPPFQALAESYAPPSCGQVLGRRELCESLCLLGTVSGIPGGPLMLVSLVGSPYLLPCASHEPQARPPQTPVLEAGGSGLGRCGLLVAPVSGGLEAWKSLCRHLECSCDCQDRGPENRDSLHMQSGMAGFAGVLYEAIWFIEIAHRRSPLG